jgi:hypothetical protein
VEWAIFSTYLRQLGKSSQPLLETLDFKRVLRRRQRFKSLTGSLGQVRLPFQIARAAVELFARTRRQAEKLKKEVP